MLRGVPRAGGDRRRARQAPGDARRRAGLPARRRTRGLRPASPPPQRPRSGPQPAMLQVFDLLHRGDRSTRALPYAERRALLEELALDGPAWRTPASVVVDRAEDFVARVAELGLEGVVAKRLDSTYIPGRRNRSWVKHQLRREEQLTVTGLRRAREGDVEAILVTRCDPDGSLTGAGAGQFGLHRGLVERLERRLAELPPAGADKSLRIRPTCRWWPRFMVRPTDRCATRCCARCWTAEPTRRRLHSWHDAAASHHSSIGPPGSRTTSARSPAATRAGWRAAPRTSPSAGRLVAAVLALALEVPTIELVDRGRRGTPARRRPP